MSSKFAKSFLTTTITTFYSEVENFTKSKNIEIPPVSEFLQFIEFEAETKKKRSTAAPTRGKVSKDSDAKDSNDTEANAEDHCTFVGSRGGKCKSVAKKDCNGMCKKHFDQSSSEGAGVSASSAEKKTRAKSTVKTGKGLSSVVSKALEDSDREDEPEVKVQTRRTKPIDSDTEKDSKKDSEKDSKESKNKAKTVAKAESESKNSYVPITFNRDSTSFVYDENADDGFVYKKGEYDTVYAVRHRGVAVKPTRVHIEEIKKAGKAVGSMEEDR